MLKTFAPALLLALAAAPALAQTSGASVAPAPGGAASAAPSPSALTLGLGGSDWSGDYGYTSNTNIAAALLTARYSVGNLRLSASLPWMRIDSLSTVYAGVDGAPLVVAPGAWAGRSRREGVGDLTLGSAYLIQTPPAWGVDVDAFARIKLPTGASRISTGQTDVSFGADVSRPIGRLAPFVTLGYRHFGDLPTLPLHDGFAGSVGASYLFANRVTVLAAYDYAERTSRFIADASDLTGSVSAPIGRSGLRLTGYAAAGLSSGAADVSGGLSLSLGL